MAAVKLQIDAPATHSLAGTPHALPLPPTGEATRGPAHGCILLSPLLAKKPLLGIYPGLPPNLKPVPGSTRNTRE